MHSSPHPHTQLRCTARAVQLLLALPLLASPGWVSAQVAENLLANAPLGNGVSATVVKPNVALVLDDSGSMLDDNMPGDADSTLRTKKLCYGNTKNNTLAYNPKVIYKPPYKPGGTVPTGNPYKDNKPRFNDATFGPDGAWSNGYAKTGSRNLITNPHLSYYGIKKVIVEECKTVKEKGKDVTTCTNVEKDITGDHTYYYSTTTTPSATCTSSTDNTQYTAITDMAQIEGRGEKGTSAALTNYANWYSYYRTRAGMMKASTGEAFSGINENNYRVGLFFLGKNITSNIPVKISDFTGTHRNDWFTTLYGSSADKGTPLRRALSEMGRMYAGRESSRFGDPVQYSCQQNFTILTTDGYTNSEGSLDLAGNVINDLDGKLNAATDRPYYSKEKDGDTLADTAYYYYETDLRTGASKDEGYCKNQTDGKISNLCENNVPGNAKDKAAHQHMTTFTLGLGVSGNVVYEPNYESAKNDTALFQYIDIANGDKDWPKTTIVAGNCATADCPGLIDDLWHAAVNGRGTYFSASDTSSVVTGLRAALAGVSARLGSGAAAATSNLEPVAGDNSLFVATYRSVKWDGDLQAYTIIQADGTISKSETAEWSAQTKLDKQVNDATDGAEGRKIKYFNDAAKGTDYLKEFTFTNLKADGKAAWFEKLCSTSKLSQCASDSLDAAKKDLADSGANLVSYLRGNSTYEAKTGASNPLYRAREHVLGDPVNAMPVYVKQPQFDYGKFDASYNEFKNDNLSRLGNVYLAANDGMLHAINAVDGTERWAYVPSFVMPTMHKLADIDYQHQYSVDGSPTVADICTTTNSDGTCKTKDGWKTILVGGLNKGGCGYYALDVTDPVNPKGLWEFQRNQLGYSYAPPVITRRQSDKKWVAIFTSGYYNSKGSGCPTNPDTTDKTTADGKGHVFVVDAASGVLLETITTSAGKDTEPSNLGKLNAWVDDAQLNIADAVYAGDMSGNLWRFQFGSKDAFLLATLGRPITIKPELAEIKGQRVVMVGTGRHLSTPDLVNTDVQSIYGLKDDPKATSGMGDPRSTSNAAFIKKRTFSNFTNSNGQPARRVTGDDVNWATDKGWYVDLASAGERVNVDMQLQYNILTAVTNVPEDNVCTTGGSAWLYYFDIDTGKEMSTMKDIGSDISYVGYKIPSNSSAVGIKTVKLGDNKTGTFVSNSDGTINIEDPPVATGAAAGGARRTMWREILD